MRTETEMGNWLHRRDVNFPSEREGGAQLREGPRTCLVQEIFSTKPVCPSSALVPQKDVCIAHLGGPCD